ncbi:MAG: hypothetical protein WCY15_12860 [Phenylobacterium sp.]|jgi:hypothetical protein|uniref:hypothetical protein n=1 Tax=Phenylobacterium sp. TaxID=1871053 RepID=UPI002A3589B5|nr:hypothetical protein [Phenylobacterium sp.]MDX9998599.1 hypothetical protein [Phenylobacterium sp.]
MVEDYQKREAETLQPFMLAVGRLCGAWAELEFFVQQFFVGALRMPEEDASYAIANCIDFRDQIRAIKVAIVAFKMPPDWAEEVIESLDYIDNILRLRRNRYVHDRWDVNPLTWEVYRTNRTPKIGKPQSRLPRRVEEHQRAVQSLSDLEETIQAVQDEGCVLMSLALMMDSPSDYETERERTPILRERPFLHLPKGTPDQRARDG